MNLILHRHATSLSVPLETVVAAILKVVSLTIRQNCFFAFGPGRRL